jgi:ribokinase
MFGIKSFDIISIGSATRDVFLRSEQFKIIEDKDFVTGQAECVALGSKIEIKEIVFTSGGGGTNAAVTFARQGLRTACISAVGFDSDGQEIINELEREGIYTGYFQKNTGDKKTRTAYSVILVHPNAERTILSYKGEGQNFDVKKIPFHKLKTKWLFLDSLGGHYDLLEAAVRWAKDNKVNIATNPGGKELEHGLDKLKLLLENSKIVIMNQEEASFLSGIDYEKEEEIFEFMDKIINGIFIMSKGPKGVLVSDGKKIYKAGIPDSPVVERTGAGDAFSSGFVAEYFKNGNIERAIQFATANASSVVNKFGAKEGILKKDDWGPWPLVEVETY